MPNRKIIQNTRWQWLIKVKVRHILYKAITNLFLRMWWWPPNINQKRWRSSADTVLSPQHPEAKYTLQRARRSVWLKNMSKFVLFIKHFLLSLKNYTKHFVIIRWYKYSYWPQIYLCLQYGMINIIRQLSWLLVKDQ